MGLLSNRDHEDRPWGAFDRFTLNESSTIKVISVKPNQSLSLQTHEKRSEFWRILSGSGEVTIDGVVHPAKTGDEFEIPIGTQHRIMADADGLTFLEIALGEFVEHDEKRLEDSYGRSSPVA